jgi:hypothetical protein
LARVADGIGPAVEPQLREAPVMDEGSWVGLDVHARSLVAGVIDRGTGEVWSLRLPAGGEATVAWLQTLPAPALVSLKLHEQAAVRLTFHSQIHGPSVTPMRCASVLSSGLDSRGHP